MPCTSVNPWENPLRESEKQIALYTKGHFEDNGCDDVENVRTIYGYFCGGVVTTNSHLVKNILHPTLLKMIGPYNFAARCGRKLGTFEAKKSNPLYPDNIIQTYISWISNTTVKFSERPRWMSEEEILPLLSDAEPQTIEVEDRAPLYPKD